jgi:hypothetical protein
VIMAVPDTAPVSMPVTLVRMGMRVREHRLYSTSIVGAAQQRAAPLLDG